MERTVTRSLSEEYYSRSPNTQSIVKTMVQTIPTSKYKVEYSSTDAYNTASPTTRNNMVIYGLVPPTMFICQLKK
jgi:hypothetical protein